MDKDLYIMARVVVPLNIGLLLDKSDNDYVDIMDLVPRDIIRFYEMNLPKPKNGFSRPGDAEIVEASDDIFNKYRNREYAEVNVKMYFSINTRRVVKIKIDEPLRSGLLVN